MKTAVLIFCVSLCISLSFAAIARIPNAKDPKYPNKCYYEGPPKIIMEYNTKKRFSGGQCGAYTCMEDSTIFLESCGSVGSYKNCQRVPGNPASPFPRCCDEYVC